MSEPVKIERKKEDFQNGGLKFFQQGTPDVLLTVVIPLRLLGCVNPVLRCSFLHIITEKRPKVLGFRLSYVHQIHIVSFSFKDILKL